MSTNKYYKKLEKILSRAVVKLPGTGEYLSWDEICHGVFCSGSSGAGKTSGPLSWILHDILTDKSRPGGVFVSIKQDERIRIERAVKKAGREEDLIIISADSPYTVNALEYELFRKGKKNIEYNQALDLLMEISILGDHYQAGGASGNSDSDRFWDKSLRKLLLRLMMLLVLSEIPVNIPNMRRILVNTFNQEDVSRYQDLWTQIEEKTGSVQDRAIEEYQEWCSQNFFLYCFDRANAREDLSEEEIDIMQLVGDYFLKTWAKISEKTKAIVEESALGLFEPFTTGILKMHFSTHMSEEIKPERCFKESKLILIAVPLKEYGISAVYAVGIMKKLFQLCIERRVVSEEENPKPCFLYLDEYHLVCSSTSDERFQSTCRSSLCAGIYATQSINNIKISMGRNQAEAKTKALLSNLGTQIMCANICRDTCLYAAEMIGQEFIQTNSTSINTDLKGSHSRNEQLHYIIPPEYFTTLRTGGKKHRYKVDTIVKVSGKKWKTGEPFREVTFDQRGRRKSIFQILKSFFI